jgi:soluble lytic murein transglycosylase-like protein
MHIESRCNPRAVSRAGAMGLMQIMPGTWAMLTARHGLGDNPFDSRANIHAGAAYLRQMWDRYHDIRLMLAAYNAGPGRADAYAAGRRGLPAETLAYVAAIAPYLGAAASQVRDAAPHMATPAWRSASIFAARAAADPPRPPAAPGPVSASLFVPLSGRD